MASADNDRQKSGSNGGPPSLAPSFPIYDRNTFEACTSVTPIARLYFCHVLDSLIDIAYGVANDFYDRPELFTRPSGLTESIGKFHARYGTHEDMLNKAQRYAIYTPVFGLTAFAGETGNFAHLREELLAACVTYVESQLGDQSALRANVMQKHGLFKEFLNGIAGESVHWSARAIHTLADRTAFPILRNQTIAAVYGVTDEIGDQWPYAIDANASKAIEKMSHALSISARVQPVVKGGAPPLVFSRDIVTRLQRAALEGTRSLATVTVIHSESSEQDIGQLIERCYTWSKALRQLSEQILGAPARAVLGPVISPVVTALKGALGGGLGKALGGGSS